MTDDNELAVTGIALKLAYITETYITLSPFDKLRLDSALDLINLVLDANS